MTVYFNSYCTVIPFENVSHLQVSLIQSRFKQQKTFSFLDGMSAKPQKGHVSRSFTPAASISFRWRIWSRLERVIGFTAFYTEIKLQQQRDILPRTVVNC
jgi:hypothetical protein